MAPGGETSGLRTGLAMGAAKAILVSDDALAGSDALGTAKVLAAAIERANPDLVVMATESTDGYTGTLPGAGGRAPGPALGDVRQGDQGRRPSVTVERQTEAGYDEVTVPAAGGRDRDGRCGRAALPVVQGDHGGEVEAGRQADGGRSRDRRRRRWARPAPARRSPTSPPAEARGGGRDRGGRGRRRASASWPSSSS